MNWSDPAFLRTVSASVQWLVIGLASIAVMLQTAKHFIDLREKRFSSMLSSEKDKAQQAREQELREKLEGSENRIYAMDLEVVADIVGSWRDGRAPSSNLMFFAPKVAALHFLLADGNSIAIEFPKLEKISYSTVDTETVRLSFRTSAPPGSDVFDIRADTIIGIEDLGFSLVGLNHRSFSTTDITIPMVHLRFFVNGRHSFEAAYNLENTLNLLPLGEGSPWLTIAGNAMTNSRHTKR
ncbi:MAG TPA: hypothetical protein VD994_18540 [Prosthecobacter sp.]|nr:hypothetical protein [Prosthecobacter sp.]